MLNFFKTKAFKIGSLVVALAFGVMLTASAYTFTSPTLRVGSKGAAVMELQKLVGVTADGSFGPMTKAAVATWQAANGLTADGVFGPMSMAKANGGSTVIGTGDLCPNGNTLASNCATAPSGSGNVALCPNGMTLSSNCTTSAAGSTSGTLTGGAGSVTITELSTPSTSTKVGEGDVNTKVYGVEIEADANSDIAVTSMKISLVTTGSGSSKLNRYAKSVSIWYNNEKVGSAMVEDFSESSNTYSKSIAIANSVVKADTKGKFYIAVDALADIDSGNTGSSNNTWTITLTSTRYQDATGAVMTDTTGSLANTFIFNTIASTKDVELKVSLSPNTVAAKTVKLSTTTDTNQVELLKFTMKAQGSKMFIDQIPVLFTSSEGTIGDTVSNVTLVIDGQTFNESVSGAAGATQTILFNNLGLTLAEDATVTGTIYADMNDIETTSFDEGTTLDAALTSALVVATSSNYIDVEDSNGDQLVTGDRTGSAQGSTLTFRSTGVNTVMGTPTYTNTVDSSGNITQVIYTIPVAVTSFGSTLYLGQTAQLAAAATLSNAFAYVFQNSSAPTTTDVGATATATLSTVASGSDSAAVIEGTSYRLDDGQTKHFVLEVTLTTPSTVANSYRVAIKQIRTFDASTWLTGTSSALSPVEQYQTAYKFITS